MERCVQMITDKDFTPDLRRLAEETGQKTQVLILHGDSDRGMPYEASSKIVAEILGHKAHARLYERAGHGLYLTHQERVMGDILGFVKRIQE